MTSPSVFSSQMEVSGCLTLKDLISTIKSRAEQERDARGSQKENMCDRFRISPRMALKGEPIDLSKQKGLTPERYPITPVKVVDRPLADPWTPTANLKMLSSVASPEIRDREKKKELFRPIENNEPEDTGLNAQQFDAVDDMDDLEKRPSRKQKSLGLLCQKFLARYPSYPLSTEKTTISLDEAASSLGVERRRIYDIVNVLESLNLVSRVAKNQYSWHGQHNINETLRNLQQEGERQKYSTQIAYFQQRDLGIEQRRDNQPTLAEELSDLDCPSASASSRKDKSLRIMSQKFVMLFLVSATKIITLEIAAKILIEESQDISDHSKFKTKVRRLYDIANVLTSLCLIKKVHVTEERGRKPAFKWIGPVDFKTESDQKMEVTTSTSSPGSKRDTIAESSKQQRFLRHSSFNHVQPINTVKRKVCSEPSSPHKAQEASLEHDGYASKMAHLAAICRQKIEEDSKCPKFLSNYPAYRNVGHVPIPVVMPRTVDADYCTRDSGQQKLSPSHIKSQQKILTSSAEYAGHSFLPNQPYMYVPSTSVFMLCGNSGNENPLDVLRETGSSSSDQTAIQDGDRSAKRQRLDCISDSPLSLVVPKVCSSERIPCDTMLPCPSPEPCKKEETQHSAPSPACQEETTELMGTKGQERQERVASAALPQYLYVPSPAGLNGFNFFLPASQAAGGLSISQSPLPLNVPYVMVPSTALATFPIICSPAVTSSASSSDHAMNYSLPGMTTPPSHLMFGPPSVISSPIPEPSPDIQQSVISASRSQSTGPATADSSICAVQQLSVKNQKSPTPLTPKSIHPVHKDTFFKTPGSLGVSPAVRKNERSHARNSSSAQRRLDICSTTDD
ncbi:transcription factor E2F7 isoform X1 [Eleutherodactylus coqui]|uniref:transcription factor E2F7 isoform X1 n=2 Tax=Eleutherodactylus coqui TaxID=57060 RepID=UPI0034625162